MKPFHKKKTKEFIEELLILKPELKDNDEKLVSNVLFRFLLLGKHDAHQMSAWKFLEMYAKNELPSVDYITRIRRKVQEECPHLRGESWNKRHKKAESIRKTIINTAIHEVL